MPISVALPAPEIVYDGYYLLGLLDRNSVEGGGYAFTDDQIRAWPGAIFGGGAGDSLQRHSSGGGSPSLNIGRVGGRPTIHMGGRWQADSLPLPFWTPAMGDGAGQEPGALQRPTWVVAVFDFHIVMDVAAHSGAVQNSTGLYFVPDLGTSLGGGRGPPDPAPTGGNAPFGIPAGGFGVAVNDDGGGANRYEFVSYDTAGTILQNTPLVGPDPTLWSTVRFVVRAARPGALATLTVALNGTTVIPSLPFDDVLLMRPNTLNPLAFSWGLTAFWAGVAGGPRMNWKVNGKFGRFTPSGQEVQGIT